MKKLDHPNVLSILGICLESSHESGLPFMIMPFMINGDLKSYLKQKRKKTECVDQLPEVPTYICSNTCILYNWIFENRSY